MLGPSLRSKEKLGASPWGVRSISSSSHSMPTLTRQTMVLCFYYESPLFLKILSCAVKKINEYVILGNGRFGMNSNLVP